MAEVDAAGILYFGHPYRWLEEMWTDYLHALGRPLVGLLASGVGAPTGSSSARYLAPVRLDDTVQCALFVEHVGNRSFALRMDAYLSHQSLALTVATRHVWCEIGAGQLRSSALPGWLREALETTPDTSPDETGPVGFEPTA
jgi:acyl-CoA thioesterase FadM